MRLLILRVSIMDVIRRHQLDPRLPGHPKQGLVHKLLLLHPVILKLQEEIPLPEDLLIPKSGFLPLLIHIPQDIALNLPRKTRA